MSKEDWYRDEGVCLKPNLRNRWIDRAIFACLLYLHAEVNRPNPRPKIQVYFVTAVGKNVSL